MSLNTILEPKEWSFIFVWFFIYFILTYFRMECQSSFRNKSGFSIQYIFYFIWDVLNDFFSSEWRIIIWMKCASRIVNALHMRVRVWVWGWGCEGVGVRVRVWVWGWGCGWGWVRVWVWGWGCGCKGVGDGEWGCGWGCGWVVVGEGEGGWACEDEG